MLNGIIIWVAVFLLRRVEGAYPGLASFIEKVIQLIQGGVGSAAQFSAHIDNFPGLVTGKPSGLVK